jgi:Bacterial Ig-like domain (group 2)
VSGARAVRLASLAFALGISACGGGGGDGPTGVDKPASVRVTAPATDLYVGQSVQLSAAALDANGGDMAAGDATWSSTNTAVATISETGLLMAMSPGTATLRATIAGTSATIGVTIEELPGYDVTVQVTGTFAPATISIRQYGTVRFVFSGIQQNVTFATAFPGAPTNVPNTTTGTISRQFNTIGDFRYESSVSPGIAGFVKVR